MIRATFIATLFLLFATANINAAVYSTVADGSWTDDSRWSAAPSNNECKADGNDTYNIGHNISSDCSTLFLAGNVTINILNGGSFLLDGSGDVSGSMTLNVAVGGKMIVKGSFKLSGTSGIYVGGGLVVYGDIEGAGNAFDCNGFFNGGTVQIGGLGCINCTNSGDAGCTEGVPLPVNLIDFSAHAISDAAISISWITSYEKNNDRFELEKSTDGLSFFVINTQAGKLHFEGQSQYFYVDEHIGSGTFYYRLVQIDVDGARTQSNVISVASDAIGATMEAAPNPAMGVTMDIDIRGAEGVEVLIDLQDMQGNTIYSARYPVEGGRVKFSLKDFYAALAPGVYYITASNEYVVVRRKIISL